MTSNRTLIWIATSIVGVVVVAGAIVLLAGGREPETFEPGSPQAAMQAYLAAWDEGDYEAAYSFFSEGVQADASFDAYESQARSHGSYGGSDGSRATFIDDVEGDGDRVTIHLTTEEYYGDGPGAQVYRNPRQVRMIHESDGWKIDEPLIWLDPGPFGDFPA